MDWVFRRKRGSIRKENSVEFITSLRFSFYQITNTYLIQIVFNSWEELNTIGHISSYVYRYCYLGTLNYTGIEQVIQSTTWLFWTQFHQHYDYLYFLYKILFNTVYTCRFNILIIFLYFISELLWFMWFKYTVRLPILWKLIYLIKFD